MIKTRNIDPKSAARYTDSIHYHGVIPALTGTSNAAAMGVWTYSQISKDQPFSSSLPSFARVVDAIIAQPYAGAGGTSYTISVLKNGTTMFSTLGAITQAAVAGAVDSKNELPNIAGYTRPVLKTDSTVLLKKGDVISLVVVVTGTYTTGANLSVSLIVDPWPE
jgi:hypothetical protein